jgi:hypothetical protein
MVGDRPSDFGEGSTSRPPAGQWPPTQAIPTPARSRTWPALALAAIATVVAVAALIVALSNSRHAASPATTAPTYTAAEAAAALRQLCDTYKLAAQAVAIDTGGGDKALARIATTNGALMLDMAAANPALDANHRDAARALAMAYGTLTAKGTYGIATDAEYQAALDEIIAKDAVMKKVCGGG